MIRMYELRQELIIAAGYCRIVVVGISKQDFHTIATKVLHELAIRLIYTDPY
jgi:hypothetical protein